MGISHLFSDCHIEKSWPVNQSVLGGKEQNRGTITFKNIGENEFAELEQNSINLNAIKVDTCYFELEIYQG